MKTKKSPCQLVLVVVMMLGLTIVAVSMTEKHAEASTIGAPIPQQSFADVFEEVSPAVVNIAIEKKAGVRQMSDFPGRIPGQAGSPGFRPDC